MSVHCTALRVPRSEYCVGITAVDTNRDTWASARVVSEINVEGAESLRFYLGTIFRDSTTWSELNSNLCALGYSLHHADPEVWVSDTLSQVKIRNGTFLGVSVEALKNRFGSSVEMLSA